MSVSADDIDIVAGKLRDMSDVYCLEYTDEEYRDVRRLVSELRARANQHREREALRLRLAKAAKEQERACRGAINPRCGSHCAWCGGC